MRDFVRKAFQLAALLVSLSATAQRYTPNPGYFEWTGGRFTYGLRPPVRDTVSQAGKIDSVGTIVYRQQDEALYIKTNLRWVKVGKGTGLTILSTVSALSTTPAEAAVALVTDPQRGGLFYWTSTGSSDNGVSFSGPTGYWVRVYNRAEGVNVAWYGPASDGVTNDVTKIQAAIDRAATDQVGLTWLPEGNYLINTAILLPSNMHLKAADKAYIQLAKGSNQYIIRNADLTGGNTNIKVTGGVWNGNGWTQTRTVGNTVATSNFCYGFFFHKCTDIEVASLEIDSTRSWGIAAMVCNRVNIHDIHFEQNPFTANGTTPALGDNGDGVTFNADNVTIYNIKGYTNDDMVAPAAGGAIFQGQFAPFEQRSYSNISISNVFAEVRQGVPTYRAVGVYAFYPYKLSNINISNVVGTTAAGAVYIADPFTTVHNEGLFSNVNLSNIDANIQPVAGMNTNLYGIIGISAADVDNLTISGTSRTDRTNTDHIKIQDSARINNLSIIGANVTYKNISGVFIRDNGTAKNINMANVTLLDSLNAKGQYLYTRFASVYGNDSVFIRGSNINVTLDGDVNKPIVTTGASGGTRYISYSGSTPVLQDTIRLKPRNGDAIMTALYGWTYYLNGKWNIGNAPISATAPLNYNSLTGSLGISGISTIGTPGQLTRVNAGGTGWEYFTPSYLTSENDPVFTAQKGTANGVATLAANGKIPNSQIPALAISETFVVNSQAAMLALTAETGDVAVRTDLSKSFILAAEPASTLGNWQELLTPTAPVQSVNGQTGNVSLTTSNITEGANLYHTTARARTSISGTAPISYNNSTGVIGITQSTASSSGYLSSTDWNTFNNKVGTTRSLTLSAGTGIGITGGTQDLSANRTWTISNTGVTSVNGATGAVTVAPSAGGTGYIWNGISAQTADYNITGNGTIGGMLKIGNPSTSSKLGVAGDASFITPAGTDAGLLLQSGNIQYSIFNRASDSAFRVFSSLLGGTAFIIDKGGNSFFAGRVTGDDAIGAQDFVTLNNLATSGLSDIHFANIKSIPGQRLLGRFDGSTGGAQVISIGDGLSLNNTTGVLSNTGILNQTSVDQSAGFRINGNGYIGGNVGIGTTSPSAKLEVNGSVRSTGEYRSIISNINTVLSSDGVTGVLGTVSNHPATIWSNSAERIRVTAAGDVGIGTPTPGAKLEVNGQVKITGGSPGAGKVLTSDANGLATWQFPAATEAQGTVYGDGTMTSFPTGVTYLILQPSGNNTIQLSSTCSYPGPAGRVAIIMNPTAFTYQLCGISVSSKVVYAVWTANNTVSFIQL